jgi:hypothetical protein
MIRRALITLYDLSLRPAWFIVLKIAINEMEINRYQKSGYQGQNVAYWHKTQAKIFLPVNLQEKRKTHPEVKVYNAGTY